MILANRGTAAARARRAVGVIASLALAAIGATGAHLPAQAAAPGGANLALSAARSLSAVSAPRAGAPTAAPKVPARFKLTGSGYGHGIGMSQYGAYYLALHGKSAAQILRTYYTGAKVSMRTVSGSSRVQVYADSAKVDVFIAHGRSKVTTTSTTKAARSHYPDNTTFTLTARKGKIEVRRGTTLLGTVPRGKRAYLAWENTSYFKGSGVVTASIRKTGTSKAATHGTYRYGRLEISNIRGRVNIVNVLGTNTEYLYGLGEMPSFWGKGKGSAALQAQAIAARNYALISSGYKSGCDCNLYDDVRSQYFSGYAKESAPGGKYWKAAVNKTVSGKRGTVMTVGGRLVQAFYYSSSGGRTNNVQDVWGSKVSYLRAVKDPYSLKAPGNTNKRWTAYVSQARMKKLFPRLRNVVSVRVTARYPSGAAKTLRATDSSGRRATYTAKTNTIRFALGLKSDWISAIARG